MPDDSICNLDRDVCYSSSNLVCPTAAGLRSPALQGLAEEATALSCLIQLTQCLAQRLLKMILVIDTPRVKSACISLRKQHAAGLLDLLACHILFAYCRIRRKVWMLPLETV